MIKLLIVFFASALTVFSLKNLRPSNANKLIDDIIYCILFAVAVCLWFVFFKVV